MSAPKRFIFASDNHGDMCDPNAIKALKYFMREFKPDVRIHGGDCFDLRCLRRGAGDDELHEDLGADIDAGCDFLRWFKPTHWLLGNHDARVIDCINSYNPVMRRLASQLWENEIKPAYGKAQVFPYDKRDGVLKMGTLSFIHGYSSGMYTARRIAEIYGNVVQGHCHCSDSFSIPGLNPRVGHISGCLCKLSMTYNRTHLNTLRQSNGFIYGWLGTTGLHRVFHAQEIENEWVFPTNFVTIRTDNEVSPPSKEYRNA